MSTYETPVGIWIDGRTIYQKVLHLGALGDSNTFEHKIESMDHVIDFTLLICDSSGNYSKATNVWINKNQITIYNNASDSVVVLKYVKLS